MTVSRSRYQPTHFALRLGNFGHGKSVRKQTVVWLQNPHPNMPDFILDEADMKNVIAYIMSLKSASR